MKRIVRFDGDGLNDSVSHATGLSCEGDPGLTKQSDARDCDINNIMRRYEKTGSLPDLIVREPRFGDFSDVPTFQEAFEVVALAEEQFAALDAPVRARFQNDPAKFLAFATDDRNHEEMGKLGLLKPKEPSPAVGAAATAAPVANAAAPKGAAVPVST